MVPWVATLALELLLVIIWDRADPDNRYSVRPDQCVGNGEENETVRITQGCERRDR